MALSTVPIERWIAWNRSRTAKYTQAQFARQVTTQIRIGEVGAEIDGATLLVGRCLEVTRDKTPLEIAERVRDRRGFSYACRSLVSAADKLMQISGASGLFESNPIQWA